MDKIYKKCAICNKPFLSDIYGQGKCENCNWFNNPIGEENSNSVVFPNMVSLNKAKKLFETNQELKPSVMEFAEMCDFYGEVEFTYKGITYSLCRIGDEDKIEYGCSSTFKFFFKDTKDFIENAKTTDGHFVKDIWNKIENPMYI